jgi:predicted pyridoxine 5'-phosphate oxidase superfamily flavin-nucleotide-binding protein
MAALPRNIIEAWDRRKGPVVLATVNGEGVPNIIYATCVSRYDEETIVVADNFFDKTRKNIQEGGQGSLLFITEDDKAFQIKGAIEYHKSGALFEDMKSWNPKKHPGHAAAALKAREAYSGADKLL